MRFKILFLGLICFLLISCTQKFEKTQAEEAIKTSLELTEKDSLEILGISMESKNVALVKFNINEVQISSKMRRYDTGWLLDEVQNDFGIWISAENLINSYSNSGKLEAAMIEISTITTALVDFITDNGYLPEQDGVYSESSDFYVALSPFYIKNLPIKDPWGNSYWVYCGKTCDGNYGISGTAGDDFVVVSYGRDGEREIWEFDARNPKGGLYVIGDVNDYDKDLIMWNGSWIRAPRKSIK